VQQCEGDAHRGLVPLAVHLCQAVCINMHAMCMHLQMHHTPRRCVHVGVDALTLQEARRRRVAAHGVAGLQQLPRECLGLGGARQRRRRQQQRQQPARRADRMRVPAACVHVRVTRQRLWQVRWDNVLRMCVRERATQASQQEPLVHA
jgi:hypothetical protein